MGKLDKIHRQKGALEEVRPGQARKEVAYQPQVVQPYNPFDEFAQTDFYI